MVNAEILLINITFDKSIHFTEFHSNLFKGSVATSIRLKRV